MNGTWQLDVTWSNDQVTPVRTWDVDLEGDGAPLHINYYVLEENWASQFEDNHKHGSIDEISQQQQLLKYSNEEEHGC